MEKRAYRINEAQICLVHLQYSEIKINVQLFINAMKGMRS